MDRKLFSPTPVDKQQRTATRAISDIVFNNYRHSETISTGLKRKWPAYLSYGRYGGNLEPRNSAPAPARLSSRRPLIK
jgi:hypothetical protein